MKRHLTERGWSTKLARPIVLRDGTTLATLADVRSFNVDHDQEWRPVIECKT